MFSRRAMGFLSLLLLALLLLDPTVEAGRRRRGGGGGRDRRRRRTRRTKPAKCTYAAAYDIFVTAYKKKSEKEIGSVGPTNAEMECMTACQQDSNSWQYFELAIPADEKAPSTCTCTKGKVKKVKKANFKFATGGLDIKSSELLMKKGKKSLAASDKACSTTPNAAPIPLTTSKVFEVQSGFATDPAMLWNGETDGAPAESYFRSDELNDWNGMDYDEFRVSVMSDGEEQAHFSFANVGGKAGFFTEGNLASTSYTDFADPEFFQVESYDTENGGHDMNLPSYNAINWSGDPAYTESNWFSEENGGMSNQAAWPVVGMRCQGGYCDNKRLRWTNSLGEILDLSKQKKVRTISEEDGGNGKAPYNSMKCNSDYGVENSLVSQMKCTGDNCDNVTVYCAPLKPGWRVVTSGAATSNWFSDDSTKDCGRDRYLAGLYCRGSWCDDLNMLCLKLERYDASIGREWYIANHDGCDKDNGWLTLDSGKENYDADGCDWEHDEKLQIFYGPDNKKATWLTGAGRADSLVVSGVKYRDWNYAFKIGTEGSEVDVWDLWQNGGSVGIGEEGPQDPASPNGHYRNPILDLFFTRNQAGRVKYHVYKDGEIVKKIEFIVNAGDPKNHSFMTASNLVKSDWAGVKPGMTSNFFSVAGDSNIQRNFFIQHNYDGCDVDAGWLVVEGKYYDNVAPCPWENSQNPPFIMYSPGDDKRTWQTADEKAAGPEADSFAVFISFRSNLGYERKPKGCVNGENIVKYELKTVTECAALCDETEGCKGFEYGIEYREDGEYKNYDCQLSSSADMSGCNGEEYNLDFYMPVEEAD